MTPPLSTLFITLHSLKIMESLDNRFTSQVDFKWREPSFAVNRSTGTDQSSLIQNLQIGICICIFVNNLTKNFSISMFSFASVNSNFHFEDWLHVYDLITVHVVQYIHNNSLVSFIGKNDTDWVLLFSFI